MKAFTTKLAAALVAVLLAAFTLSPALAAEKVQTFTGKVTDAMCGAKHMMPGDAAACLRDCVAKGSKYALLVGDKVYTLDTSDKATLDKLNQLADQQAKVTGTASGDTIAVAAVAPGK